MARSSLYIGYTTLFGGIFGYFGGGTPIVGGILGYFGGMGHPYTLYGGGGVRQGTLDFVSCRGSGPDVLSGG